MNSPTAAMDTEEDFELFSPSDDERSSPVPDRKLKRLKKGRSVEVNRLPSEPQDVIEANLSPSESPDVEESDGQEFQEPRSGSRSTHESFDEEDELSSGFDGLGVEDTGLESGTKRMLDFESLPEEEYRNSEDLSLDMEIEHSKEKDSGAKEIGTGKSDEKKEKKRKKRVKDHDDDILESTAPPKRSTEKERTKRLAALRAESQRLLRETRDAAFKPAPMVQKPISSLLQKIRQRKLEVIKKTIVADGGDLFSKETMVELDSEEEIVIEGEMNDSVGGLAREGGISSQDISEEPNVDKLGNTGNHSSIPPEMVADEVPAPKQPLEPPVIDTEDVFPASQTSDSKEEISDEGPNSPVEVPTPSVAAMNFDSALPDDISSDEEENDKENEVPSPRGRRPFEMSSSPNGDPVKGFLDDEAEEEDDSDNDRLCLGDNDDEEDEDSEDSEEFEDIIAKGFEEKPSDIERRMEHHQELLNQLDAAETEKILRRWGLKPKVSLLEEEVDEGSEDERGEDDMKESDDEASENIPATTSVRMSIKKLREMIPHMFTDKDDVYISDDEETEKSLVQQRLSEKADKQAKFLPPSEDPRSKEFFGQIKQVNRMPRPRKRARNSSSFNGVKGNTLQETSFIGRGSKGSLPSIKKNGSNMGRSFIFERDATSNGRNKISAAEDSSDKVQREARPAKPASAKFSGSQATSTSQNKKPEEETDSRTPLLDILRRSSLQLRTSHCTRESSIDRHESIFTAFKLEKKTAR